MNDKEKKIAEHLTFPKSERLRHKILVDALFAKGKTLFEYPLRLTYRPLSASDLENSFRMQIPEGIAPLQVMITVPKKKRRHAVDRVLIRRRIREAWRLQRRQLRRAIEGHPELRSLSVAIIYQADYNIESTKIVAKISRLIAQLLSRINAPKIDNHSPCEGE